MDSFIRQLNITTRCGNRFRELRLSDTGLSGCQVPYLFVLYRRPGISQEELSKALYINKSNVARQLSLLEREGYVRRENLPEDKRVSLVYPTEKAIAIKKRIIDVQHEWLEYLTADLSREEYAQLVHLMNCVTTRAEIFMKEGEGKCAL